MRVSSFAPTLLLAIGVAMALLGAGQTLESLREEQRAHVEFSRRLLLKWCEGKASAVEIAADAKAVPGGQAHIDPILRALAKVDNHNAHRDVCRIIQRMRPTDLPPLYYAQLPLWNTDLNKSEMKAVPLALPHEHLQYLGANNVGKFTTPSGEMAVKLQEWRNITKVAEAGPPIAALSVWGDTAPFHTSKDNVLLLLWSCVSGDAWERRWVGVLTKNSLCQCGCAGLHTLDEVWRVLAWIFRAQASGVYPSVDHDGHAFVEPWRRDRAGNPMSLRGAVVMFRGDWPWLTSVFKLATHASTHACFLCNASMDMECPITDASSTALWRSTVVDPTTWLRDKLLNNKYVSGVFAWPGVGFSSIVLDWMHMVDLGVAQSVFGNVLWEIFRGPMCGQIGNPAPTLSMLQTMLSDAANDLGMAMPFTKLTLAMIRTESLKPRLKLKAAKTRDLAPIVLRLLESHFPAHNERGLRRYNCLEFLVKAYGELGDWKAGSAV